MNAQKCPRRHSYILGMVLLITGVAITCPAEAHDRWDNRGHHNHHRDRERPLIQFSFGAPMAYAPAPIYYYAPAVYAPPRPVYRPVTYYYPAPAYGTQRYGYSAYHCPHF